MKKQIVNKETRQIVLLMDLNSDSAQKWVDAIKKYDFGYEIEVISVIPCELNDQINEILSEIELGE